MTEEKLLAILETARLAPSVHNTQPWRASTDGKNIYASIDTSIDLSESDPTRRETIISLGIFCEAIKLSSESAGFSVGSIDYKDGTATIILNDRSVIKNDGLIQSLISRSTDRSIYKPANITPDLTQRLKDSPLSDKTEVKVVTDRETLNLIAELTSKGISLALSSPTFKKELSRYLILPGSSEKRGISVNSLAIPKFIAILQPTLMKLGIGQGKESALEKKRWQSASAVAVILGDGDTEAYWFEAGRTYLQVSLVVESADLAQATSAAIVEASNYHEDIENVLGTTKRVLSLIRIGQGQKKRPHSPRVSAQELLH